MAKTTGTGRVLIDLDSTQISPIETELLTHPAVAGVVLFTKNFHNPSQLRDLTAQIRATNPDLLITVDHEGGRVWRFKTGFTLIPAMRLLGHLYDNDPTEACTLAHNIGWILASELLSFGIDLSFTPVLDLDQGLSTVIGDRALHSDPKIVGILAKALISGLKAAGMQATGKHFPGHGGSALDSHLTAVTDTRTLATLRAEDLVPFTERHTELGAVMTAHVTYPTVDPAPATYSSFWLQTMLREQIGFQGAIISDCLSMQAAATTTTPTAMPMLDRLHRAFNAGCDLAILCQQPREALLQTLEQLQIKDKKQAEAATQTRIAALKGNFALKAWEKSKPEIGLLWAVS